MQPLVSICIPTYNRAECLKKTIESVICQPEFQSGEVEIVVSDNASTDNTSEVCNTYVHFPNFYYYRNEKNVRDINFPIVLSEAHGELRKLNNDTYVLNDGSLHILCELVKKYNDVRPFIFLRMAGNEIKELNFHDFVLDVSYWVTWLTSFTIWDSDCINIESDTDGCELLFWQVRKAYELAYNSQKIVEVCNEIGISIAPPKKYINYDVFDVFYNNYMKLLQPYIENNSLSEEDIECIEKDLLFKYFPYWLLRYELKDSGVQFLQEKNLKEEIWNHYRDKAYWNEFINIYNKRLLKAKLMHIVKKILGKA